LILQAQQKSTAITVVIPAATTAIIQYSGRITTLVFSQRVVLRAARKIETFFSPENAAKWGWQFNPRVFRIGDLDKILLVCRLLHTPFNAPRKLVIYTFL